MDQILQLKDCVIPDMTLADASHILVGNMRMQYALRAWDEMIGETDAVWCQQGQQSLMNMVPVGRMRLKLMFERDNQEVNGKLGLLNEHVDAWAAQAASRAVNAKKSFDMIIHYPALKMREIEIPGVDETGSLKTKTITEKERSVSYEYVENQITFNGWRLAHFERNYRIRSANYQTMMNWDFALGEDGIVYHITSGYTTYVHPTHQDSEDDKFFYQVREAFKYDLCLLKNRNQAYFIAVSHGELLTVNSILKETRIHPEKNQITIRSNENEEYLYNFPINPSAGIEPDAQEEELKAEFDFL